MVTAQEQEARDRFADRYRQERVDIVREIEQRVIPSDVDRAILARTIVEIITTWAVRMAWDWAPRPYPDDTAAACATMIRHLVTGGPDDHRDGPPSRVRRARLRSRQAGHPSGMLVRIVGRLVVKDTAGANDRALAKLDLTKPALRI